MKNLKIAWRRNKAVRANRCVPYWKEAKPGSNREFSFMVTDGYTDGQTFLFICEDACNKEGETNSVNAHSLNEMAKNVMEDSDFLIQEQPQV